MNDIIRQDELADQAILFSEDLIARIEELTGLVVDFASGEPIARWERGAIEVTDDDLDVERVAQALYASVQAELAELAEELTPATPAPGIVLHGHADSEQDSDSGEWVLTQRYLARVR